MESGTRLGPYEILEQLGVGGMGEVYLAHDARLDRDVAIKVLPSELASDPERLARLEREARVLASLDHPNVAAVYGLEESDGVRFLVMQLAAGETLADRLTGGPMALDEVVDVATQLADGLEAAHEGGVVHRDLKPANIMVAPGDEVKILDFGLAKALGSEAGSGSRASDLTASPTMMAVTSAGMILGTAAYMSPEQARGKPLDRRTDIWSFGCVLFEMLAGEKAFGGETLTDVMAAIVTRDPDWDQLPATVPPWLMKLLRRCLDKNPRHRLRDMGEARIALVGGDDDPPEGLPDAVVTESTRTWTHVGLAAAGMAVLGGAIGWWASTSPAPVASPRYVALYESGLRLVARGTGAGATLAIAPDGQSLAIAGTDGDGAGIWIRRLDQPIATRLADLEGTGLSWSPDGQLLAFIDGDRIRVYDSRTGASATRYEAQGAVEQLTWTADGGLIVGEQVSGTLRILEVAASGETTVLTRIEDVDGDVLRLQSLGGGRFLLGTWSQERGGVDTAVVHADGQVDEPMFHLDATVEWVPPDLVLFPRDGSLWGQRMDPVTGQLRGEAVALLVDIDTAPSSTPWLSVGGETLSYRTGTGGEAPTVLEWVDREGELVEQLGEPGNYYDPRIAPTGRDIVFDLSDQGDAGDIWVSYRDGLSSRLTSSVADETRPVWAPDGRRVVLEATFAGQEGNLYFKDVNDPAGELLNVGADPQVDQPTDWVGNTILGNDVERSTIWIVDATTGESRPFRQTGFADYGGALSPDGSRIAYVSDETGRDEVWVESFPNPGDRRRISVAGGRHPAWRRDGKEIVYSDPEGFITSVAVRSIEPLDVGEPESLFQVALRDHAAIRQYDVSADGQRFLINRLVELPDQPISLLLGWRQELERRAGRGW